MRSRIALALVCIAAAASACVSYVPVDVAVSPSARRIDDSQLRVGDSVEVVTLDQRRVRFKITSLDPESIQGPNLSIPTREVKSVAVRRFGVTPSTDALEDSPLGVFGALAGAAVAVLILIAVL